MPDNPFASDENPYEASQITVETPAVGKADPGFNRTATILSQTRPWVRFMSVMLFICAGFMVLAGIGMALFIAIAGGAWGMALLGLLYVAFAILYIAPGVFLWTYANRIDIFLRQRTTDRLDSALEAQKSFWKFIGIMMIIMLGLYLLILVVGVLGAGVSSLRYAPGP